MKEIIVTGIFTIIAAAIGGLISLFTAKSKERENKLEKSLRKSRSELLMVYKDMLEMWKSEENLINLAGISKIEARKDRKISKKAEPARISQRIKELESQLVE